MLVLTSFPGYQLQMCSLALIILLGTSWLSLLSLLQKNQFNAIVIRMNLISATDISKDIADRQLFVSSSFGIDDQDKIGFIGNNGSGKSTLMAILAGEIKIDDGLIAKNNDLRMVYLKQNVDFRDNCNLQDFFFEMDYPDINLIAEYKSLTAKNALNSQEEELLQQIMQSIEKKKLWDLENRYLSLLVELGLSDHHKKMIECSGGMQKKAALARVLALDYNLLLLDEPTNHLDMDCIEWLENYLKSSQKAFLLVTHDRCFLDRICNFIMEIDQGQINKYPGKYSDYLKRRQIRLQIESRARQRTETILKQELKWLQRGPKARTGKDKQRKAKVENLMQENVKAEQKNAAFSSQYRRLGKKIIDLHRVEKSFGSKRVMAPFTYSFKKKERIGIIGPNGSGKTSFLKLLAGKIEPDNGKIKYGINTAIAYFDQINSEMPLEKSILAYLKEEGESLRTENEQKIDASRLAEDFGFPAAKQRLPIKRLSGGERRRLYLLRVLATAPNFLMLDEPTNDLDLDTLNMLEDYLEHFSGCLLIVSHDRTFLEKCCDYLFIFGEDGEILGFCGSYEEYRESLKYQNSKAKSKDKFSQSLPKKKKKGLSFNEKRELEELNQEIEELEKQKTDLEAEFSSPQIDPLKLAEKTREHSNLEKLIDQKTLRWEELIEKEEAENVS